MALPSSISNTTVSFHAPSGIPDYFLLITLNYHNLIKANPLLPEDGWVDDSEEIGTHHDHKSLDISLSLASNHESLVALGGEVAQQKAETAGAAERQSLAFSSIGNFVMGVGYLVLMVT